MEQSGTTETTTDGTTTEMTVEPTNTPTMTPTTTASPKTATTTATSTTATTSTTTAAASGMEVSIESSTLEKEETSIGTDAYALATIVNTGDSVSGELTVEGRFYDGDDNLLGSTTATLPYLNPGETWVSHVPYLDDGEAVKGHEVDGEYGREPPRLEIDGLTVSDTSLSKDSVSAAVSGTIENELEDDANYLGARARFWQDDVILGGGLDNITDVPAGEDWSFEATYMGYGERWKDANDYDVIPELTIY